MSDVPDPNNDGDADEIIGSAVLLLLEQKEEISSLSILKKIRASSCSMESAKNEAISFFLDSIKGPKDST